jgi:hypothetical protein
MGQLVLVMSILLEIHLVRRLLIGHIRCGIAQWNDNESHSWNLRRSLDYIICSNHFCYSDTSIFLGGNYSTKIYFFVQGIM